MSNGFNQDLFGTYATKTFSEIYKDLATFKEGDEVNEVLGFNTQPFPKEIKDSSIDTIYYLLIAKYGNSHISNMDIHMFQLRLWSMIYQYASTWETKLANQAKLRALKEEDIRVGSRQINNHSYNPGEPPSTGSFDELGTINEQNTLNWQKSKMDAYVNLQMVLNDKITEKFLDRFKVLFITIVNPYNELLYDDNEEE